MSKKNIWQFLEFITSSLCSTGIDFLIYTILNNLLDSVFPILYLTISTFIARFFSDLTKYLLDKKMVFNNGGSSPIRYIILAVSKTVASSLLVTVFFFLTRYNRTLIKALVDSFLFIPSFFIAKYWVYKTR